MTNELYDHVFEDQTYWLMINVGGGVSEMNVSSTNINVPGATLVGIYDDTDYESYQYILYELPAPEKPIVDFTMTGFEVGNELSDILVERNFEIYITEDETCRYFYTDLEDARVSDTEKAFTDAFAAGTTYYLALSVSPDLMDTINDFGGFTLNGATFVEMVDDPEAPNWYYLIFEKRCPYD